jgi:hypothetical protein
MPPATFRQSHEYVSRVEMILDRSARVLSLNEDQAYYMSWQIGMHKLLQPGAACVLAINYPEDVDRSWIMLNTGNESARGFHTGQTNGGALHSKYVNSLSESVSFPLTRRRETWTLLFHLHDGFTETGIGARPRSANVRSRSWVRWKDRTVLRS